MYKNHLILLINLPYGDGFKMIFTGGLNGAYDPNWKSCI